MNVKSITKQSLRQLYQNQPSIRQNDAQIHSIVEILGGIDSVMNKINMNDQQLNEIHMLLTKSDRNKPISVHTNAESEKSHPIYYFDNSKTFMMELWKMGRNETLFNILYIIHSLVLCVGFTLYIMRGWANFTFMFSCYFIPYMCIVAIPHDIITILYLNPKACKLLFASFDTWIKISYGMTFSVTSCVYFYKWSIRQNFDDYLIILLMIATVSFAIHVVLFMTHVTCLDASTDHKLIQIGYGILATVFCLGLSIYYQLIRPDDENSIIHITDNHSFSLSAILSSSLRIMGIFTAKQVYFLIFRPNKCSVIKITPDKVWCNENENELNKQIQNQNKSDIQLNKMDQEQSKEAIEIIETKTVTHSHGNENESSLSSYNSSKTVSQ